MTLLELLPHFHLYSFAVNCRFFLSDFVCHLSVTDPGFGSPAEEQLEREVLGGGPGMLAITCCLPPPAFQTIFAHGGKVGRRRRQVAINVGSLSTQGLFRPLPAIRLLIGKHLVHTWMGSSHELHPARGNKPFFHYRRPTLSPLTKPQTSREPQIKWGKICFFDKISQIVLPAPTSSFFILMNSISVRGLISLLYMNSST